MLKRDQVGICHVTACCQESIKPRYCTITVDSQPADARALLLGLAFCHQLGRDSFGLSFSYWSGHMARKEPASKLKKTAHWAVVRWNVTVWLDSTELPWIWSLYLVLLLWKEGLSKSQIIFLFSFMVSLFLMRKKNMRKENRATKILIAINRCI